MPFPIETPFDEKTPEDKFERVKAEFSGSLNVIFDAWHENRLTFDEFKKQKKTAIDEFTKDIENATTIKYLLPDKRINDSHSNHIEAK